MIISNLYEVIQTASNRRKGTHTHTQLSVCSEEDHMHHEERIASLRFPRLHTVLPRKKKMIFVCVTNDMGGRKPYYELRTILSVNKIGKGAHIIHTPNTQQKTKQPASDDVL